MQDISKFGANSNRLADVLVYAVPDDQGGADVFIAMYDVSFSSNQKSFIGIKYRNAKLEQLNAFAHFHVQRQNV